MESRDNPTQIAFDKVALEAVAINTQATIQHIIEDGVEFRLTVALVRRWVQETRELDFAKGDLWWVRRINGLPMTESERTLKFRTFHEMLDWLLNADS